MKRYHFWHNNSGGDGDAGSDCIFYLTCVMPVKTFQTSYRVYFYNKRQSRRSSLVLFSIVQAQKQ